MEQLLVATDTPPGHLAYVLTLRFGFGVDEMVDFVQAGHGTDTQKMTVRYTSFRFPDDANTHFLLLLLS